MHLSIAKCEQIVSRLLDFAGVCDRLAGERIFVGSESNSRNSSMLLIIIICARYYYVLLIIII